MGQQESQLKPKAVDDLMRMTNFTGKELQGWYQEFNKDANNGRLSKNEFIKIFDSIFPNSDGNDIANHVFRTFDVNKDGVLNFREFVIGLSLSLCGNFDEKLYWAFHIYDVDGNGFISQSEMKEIVTGYIIQGMSRHQVDLARGIAACIDIFVCLPLFGAKSFRRPGLLRHPFHKRAATLLLHQFLHYAAMCALCRDKNLKEIRDDEFFVNLDKDNDGQVSWAEFRKGVYENKLMTQFLSQALGCVKDD